MSTPRPQSQSPRFPAIETKVALVPLDGVSIDESDLDAAAAALAQQIEYDVGPVWGVAATVDAYSSLDDVPADHVPLVIVPDDEALPDHGFHFDLAGRPCALVTDTPGKWTQYASHELIELLCDPSGVLTVPGPSLDPKAKDKHNNPQIVNYLVEVCDAVEESTYPGAGGLPVSDFVYPAYYAEGPKPSPGTQYSRRGTIKGPRQLLEGGYISWQTLDTGKVFQAFAGPRGGATTASSTSQKRGGTRPGGSGQPTLFKGAPDIQEVKAGSSAPQTRSRVTRQWVGIHGRYPRRRRAAAAKAFSASRGRAKSSTPPGAGRARGRGSYPQVLRDDIQTFIDLVSGKQAPPPTTEDLIRVLKAARGKSEPKARRAALMPIEPPKRNSRIPSDELLDNVISALQSQDRVARVMGEGVFGTDIASWLCHMIP